MATQDSRKLKGQEEGVVAATAAPSIAIPSSTEGEAAAVSDGYFLNRSHAPTGGEYHDAGFNTVDFDTPAPPYTPPSHSLFPPPPKRTCGGSTTTTTTISRQARGIAPPDSTRLQIPRPPTRVYINHDNSNHNNNASSPATPMSQHSMHSFETARDLEKGSLKLKLTRSTTYHLLKPFFSRSSDDPADGSAGPAAALNVSKRRSTIIAVTVLTVTVVLVMGLLFGLMKWFD